MITTATCTYDPEVAEEYGLEEAILLKNFDLWTSPDKENPNDRKYFSGRYWICVSLKELHAIFYHMSISTIRRTLDNLLDEGLLMKDNFNPNPLEKILWYALTDIGISKCRNRQYPVSKSATIYIPYYINYNITNKINKIYIKYYKKGARTREELSNDILDNEQLPCDIDNVCFAKGKVYGKHNNIPLSDKEVELLKKEFPKPEANIPWELAIDSVSSYLHRNPKAIDNIGNFYEYISTWNYDGAVRNFEAQKRAESKSSQGNSDQGNLPQNFNKVESKQHDEIAQERINSGFTELKDDESFEELEERLKKESEEFYKNTGRFR